MNSGEQLYIWRTWRIVCHNFVKTFWENSDCLGIRGQIQISGWPNCRVNFEHLQHYRKTFGERGERLGNLGNVWRIFGVFCKFGVRQIVASTFHHTFTRDAEAIIF